MNIFRTWRRNRLTRKLAQLEAEWGMTRAILKSNEGHRMPMSFVNEAQRLAGRIASVRMHLEQLK